MTEMQPPSPNPQTPPNYLKAIFQLVSSLVLGLFALLTWQIISFHEARYLQTQIMLGTGESGLGTPSSWFGPEESYRSIPGIQILFYFLTASSLASFIRGIRTARKIDWRE